MKKTLITALAFVAMTMISFSNLACLVSATDNNQATAKENTEEKEKKPKVVDPNNPEPYEERKDNLDYIFNPNALAEITLDVSRTEWNHLLKFYDWNDHNEEYVHVDFQLKKGNYTWKKDDAGLKLRGNTSRCRPQEGWGSGNNDYQQAHFKIDFEEFLSDTEEWKLADSMKGIILKRFKDDPTFAREVFVYNFFRDNGVWTAPRSGYAHLTIKIKDSNGNKESVDYGIYEMVEAIDKQFLKARTSKNSGGDFTSAGGNLWKCSNPANLSDKDSKRFGVEDVHFEGISFDDENLGTNEDKSTYEKFVNKTYNYDLKTNKKELDAAKTEIKNFITELNSLKNDTAQIKAWYESHMDMDLFLKTYAINVLFGMWDDYWNNSSNYYFYFDPEGKAYFIPYDYDNVMGVNIGDINWIYRDPTEWGAFGNPAPLIEKALSVPEYMTIYKKYLISLSAKNTAFDPDKAAAKITGWHNLFSDKVFSSQLKYDGYDVDAFGSIYDATETYWGNPWIHDTKIYTPDDPLNYFENKARAVRDFLGVQDEEESEEPETDDAEFNKNLLPVVYDSTDAGNEVKIFFRTKDWSLPGGKTSDDIYSVCLRGVLPNETSSGYVDEICWEAEKQIRMNYDSTKDQWYYFFPKEILDCNFTQSYGINDYIFKFVIEWKDSNGTSGSGNYEWMEYSWLTDTFPKSLLYVFPNERQNDYKYKIKAICDYWKSNVN